MFEHLFLESPWAVMVVLAVGAVMLFSAGNKRHHKGLMIGSGVALALAVGVYLLAQAVTTGREQLIRDTQSLVAATAPLDPAVLDRLLDSNVVVTGPDGSVWVNAGQVMPRLRSAVDRFTINSQQVRSIQAVVRDNGWGESALTVRTDISDSGTGPVNTGWVLSWRHDLTSDTWQVVDIRWIRFNGVEVQKGLMP